MDLSGIWQATEALGEQARAGRAGYVAIGWHTAPVPGYFAEVEGVAPSSDRLLFRRVFVLDAALPQGAPHCLRLEGVNGEAKVWCNGSFVGEQRGSFVPHTYDVTRHLDPGENVVMIEVSGPRSVGGIVRGVRLESSPVARPERLLLQAVPSRIEGGQAKSAAVDFDFSFTASAPDGLEWVATVAPETFTGDAVTLRGGGLTHRGWNRVHGKLTLENPHLWWTWDRGLAEMYRFVLELRTNDALVQRVERLFGVRTVEFRDWTFFVNRQRLFLRGAALGPADLRHADTGPAILRQDLDRLAAAHMNTVWVREHIAEPILYEEASRRGMLIWQEVPTDLPNGEDALAMLDHIGAWPAVGLWLSLNSRAAAVAATLQSDDPNRPCLTRMEGSALFRGDENIRRLPDKARFAIDFGLPSFPSPEHSRRFVTGKWPDLNLATFGAQRLERELPVSMAQSLEQYEVASQAYQAFQVRQGIEHFRSKKYSPCYGVLLAQFIDGEPTVSPALVDYWREPKAGYAAVAEALRPVQIMAEWPHSVYLPGESIELDVTILNDTNAKWAGEWSWAIVRDGESLASGGEAILLEPDTRRPLAKAVNWTVPEGLKPGTVELVLTLTGPELESIVSRYGFDILPGR